MSHAKKRALKMIAVRERNDGVRWRRFLKYQNIARRIASDFATKFNKPYKQMCEAAEYALMLELFGRKKYAEQHGTKRSTWLYTVVYFHMTQVCTRGVHPCPAYPGSLQVHIKEFADEVPFTSLHTDDQPSPDAAAKLSALELRLNILSDEARQMLLVILQAPAELADVVKIKSARQARESIRAYMIDELDWTSNQVTQTWNEIAESLES